MGQADKNENWGVVGHQSIIDVLRGHIEQDKVNHAYLFVGPESVGKKKVATEFARSLFCSSATRQKPCGKCTDCKDLDSDKQVDFRIIKTIKGNVGIPQVRKVQHDLSLSSYSGGYKVCVIDGADRFTLPAANAILKILEEPAQKIIFILLAESLEGVIPTIISRSLRLNFNLVPHREIEDFLAAPGSKVIARAAWGRPGLAIKYAKNPDKLEERNSQVQKFLAVIDQDINQSFQFIGKEKMKSDQAERFITIMVEYFRDLAIAKSGCKTNILGRVDTNGEYQKHLDNYSGRQIENVLNYLMKAKKLLKQNINPKLILENFILTLHHE